MILAEGGARVPGATMAAMRTAVQLSGDDAERRVAMRLEAAGWTIIGRNIRIGRGEIDIVAVDPGPPPHLVIIEVRRRSSRRFGLAEETVDWRKRAHLRTAVAGLRESGWAATVALPALPMRVDLVAVEPPSTEDGSVRLRHHRAITL